MGKKQGKSGGCAASAGADDAPWGLPGSAPEGGRSAPRRVRSRHRRALADQFGDLCRNLRRTLDPLGEQTVDVLAVLPGVLRPPCVQPPRSIQPRHDGELYPEAFQLLDQGNDLTV